MKSVNASTFTDENKDEEKNLEPICDICCDDGGIDEGMEWSKLLCGHSFHHLCIHQWFAKHTSCPMCRATIHKCLTCQESFSINLPSVSKGCLDTYTQIFLDMKSKKNDKLSEIGLNKEPDFTTESQITTEQNYLIEPSEHESVSNLSEGNTTAHENKSDKVTLLDLAVLSENLDEATTINCGGTMVNFKPEHKKSLFNIGNNLIDMKAEDVDKVVFDLINIVKIMGVHNNVHISERELQGLAHFYKGMCTKCVEENVFKLTGDEQSTAMDHVITELQAETESIISAEDSVISGELPIFLPPTDSMEEN